MKLHQRTLIAISLSALLHTTTASADTSTAKSIYERYKINRKSNPSMILDNIHHLRAGIKWNTSGTCGDFDMSLSVMNNIDSAELKAMMNNFIAGAKAAFDPASLLSLAFMRANPDLYELIQNGIIQAQAFFEEDMNVCETIQNTILDSAPSGWVDKLAVGEEFTKNVQLAYSGASVDVGDLTDFVGSAGERGFTLLGTEYGGEDEPDAEIVDLASIAGFNIGREKTGGLANDIDVSNISSATPIEKEKYPFTQLFNKPSDLSDFIVDIVGEVTINTRDDDTGINHEKGIGSSRHIYNTKQEIIFALGELKSVVVTGNAGLIKNELDEFNDNMHGAYLTGLMARELERMNDGEYTEFANALAHEWALNSVIHKIVVARKLLTMGKNESSIYDATQVRMLVIEKIRLLDLELEDIEREERVKRMYAENVSDILFKRALEASQKGVNVDTQPNARK